MHPITSYSTGYLIPQALQNSNPPSGSNHQANLCPSRSSPSPAPPVFSGHYKLKEHFSRKALLRCPIREHASTKSPYLSSAIVPGPCVHASTAVHQETTTSQLPARLVQLVLRPFRLSCLFYANLHVLVCVRQWLEPVPGAVPQLFQFYASLSATSTD